MILIVEDDPQVARLIALVLRRSGKESEIVVDGETALVRAKEKTPEMIFADLTLRGMGGADLCMALKAAPETRSIPFVIVSGDGELAEKARACGADGHMGKPFEFDDLVRLVTKHAQSRQAR